MHPSSRRLVPTTFATCLVVGLVFTSITAVFAQAGTTRLMVFAASSLTEAFEAIATGFEAAHPGVEVDLNFGGSSILATQIVQGAPADVFASADQPRMAVVVDAGLTASTPRVFAGNVQVGS